MLYNITNSLLKIFNIFFFFRLVYGKILEDDLRADTSGNFKRLMVSLCCANRDESFDVNHASAIEDAKELLKAGNFCNNIFCIIYFIIFSKYLKLSLWFFILGELRFGTDESVFNSILVQRNVPQLKQIFEEYENITGNSIETAIKNEFSGDIKKGLLAIGK